MVHRNVRGGVPSPYPRFIFHGLRSAQLLAGIVVSGIMVYFIYYLRLENLIVPWTFIVLLTVSISTILALTITIILYNFTYLSPLFNLFLNGGISIFWVLGLGLLSWSVSISHVLEKACTGFEWGGEAEAGVCRDYKALWGMTVVGTISTLSALTLDILIQRKVTSRGKYNLPSDLQDTQSQKLNDLKNIRLKTRGYQAPKDQDGDGIWRDDHLHGEEYHNRYGARDEEEGVEVLPAGPLEGRRDGSGKSAGFKD